MKFFKTNIFVILVVSIVGAVGVQAVEFTKPSIGLLEHGSMMFLFFSVFAGMITLAIRMQVKNKDANLVKEVLFAPFQG